MSKNNKVALITGSGHRLGRRIALALAERGYDVVINYLNSRKQALETGRTIRRLGREALVVRADVRKRREVRRMVEMARKRFGNIDLLVNNAAIFPKRTDFLSVTDRMWHDVLNANLYSCFLCAQEVARSMVRNKRGRIINVASLGGIKAWKNHVPYSVAKAGLIMLTRAMAKSLAPYITVNAIAPGTILIPGEETGRHAHPAPEHIPLGKYGMPEDITRTVLFLAESAPYMTGQVIPVDGGLSIP